MVFTTPAFLFLFMPLFFLLYYLVPEKMRTSVILLGSWLFYAFWRVDFLLLLIGVSLGNYLFGRSLYRNREQNKKARLLLATAVASNLSILAYFKYFNFGADSLNALLELAGLQPLAYQQVILPIGISFYIFQSMSYVIDVYRNDAPPADSFFELATYVTLFPQLIAGPILRYKDIIDQLKQREHNLHLFGQGFVLFAIGVCKKVLIADTVAPLADVIFAQSAPTFIESWLGTAAYAIQIYFDFSGYSDMALGLGQMMGFHFKKNFDAPYKSASITEFWQRWHISLSRWLRDYLYIPLGGNRKGSRRTYLNLFLVMFLGGLWHGAAWNFALWGIWHGLWLMIERKSGLHLHQESTAKKTLHHVRTLILVGISWVFFRAGDFNGITSMLSGMFGLNGLAISASVSWQLSRFSLFTGAVAVLLIVFEEKYHDDKALNTIREKGMSHAVIYTALLGLSVLKILSDSYSPFLYFRF
ncbi:MBOAT family O-acyltransferase [Spirochaeta isovalerica]|uniref:Alginate O-acetyltransferase complex protein AlgI n=1 Tax=Spirochaeta isovalerica TaxID=150 RepID=A0A841RGP1_9SPIO|nr:MBOAT family protein [Spirochaeta isovalerica]MBB6482377.1 alginate O-acetyltransferase complex protein AlgI [Spirochaeta isovalerica]